MIIHTSTRSGRVGVARRLIDLSGEYSAHTVDRIAGGEVGLTPRTDETADEKVDFEEAEEEALLPSPLFLLLATMNDRPPTMSHALHSSGQKVWQKSVGSKRQ